MASRALSRFFGAEGRLEATVAVHLKQDEQRYSRHSGGALGEHAALVKQSGKRCSRYSDGALGERVRVLALLPVAERG